VKKHIYIYSPSGAVRDKASFNRGIARLKSLGHEVEIDSAALSSHLRFAGDDDTRVAAIARACASGADVALISRGGYGLTRILPHIPYAEVAKAIHQGMKFVGHSDFTAFQNAVLAKTGAQTWAGPALGADFGCEDEPDDIMQACFDDLLSDQGEGSGWRLPVARRAAKNPLDNAAHATLAPQLHSPITELSASGVLWGGNLAVFVSLLGTPYFPAIQGGILFFEDVAEYPWRIERMLTQLLHAGVLAQQKAIIFGQFTDYTASSHDKGFKLQTVVDWLSRQIKVPVLMGLPFGHVPTKVLLPVGAQVALEVEGRDAFVLWGHQHEHGHDHHHDTAHGDNGHTH